jgi:hypothetical protein
MWCLLTVRFLASDYMQRKRRRKGLKRDATRSRLFARQDRKTVVGKSGEMAERSSRPLRKWRVIGLSVSTSRKISRLTPNRNVLSGLSSSNNNYLVKTKQ